MINIAVCDDINYSRIQIDKLLEPYKEKNNLSVHLFSSGEELLAFPDYASVFPIFFLDIELGGISGIDVACNIREKNTNAIIFFVTGYMDYIPDSFRVGAFQYLCKPIDENDFKKDFERALNSLDIIQKKYVIKWRDVNYILEYNEIIYIEAKNRHLFVYTENQEYECVGKLQDEYEKLKSYGFSKCHQSFLINLRKVKKTDKKSVLLDNNVKIPISRQCRQSFLQDFSVYMTDIAI